MSFLRNLECLYDSFGIGAHTIDAVQLSLQDAVCNVSSANAYIKNTVAEVRQHYKRKETAKINAPEGTDTGVIGASRKRYGKRYGTATR